MIIARPTAPARTPEQFLSAYGHRWVTGVITEHLEAFVAAGGVVRQARSGSGAAWAIVGRKAYPVLCSDLIPVQTEDGTISGRCGILAVRHGSCENHAAEADTWLAMAEIERKAWERDRDGLPHIHLV